MQRKIKIIGLVIFLALILTPISTQAALLYLDPDSGTYGPGDSFMVDIKMDVNTGCINTVEGFIFFPNEYLSLLDFYTGESMISVWIEKPNKSKLDKINEKGEVYFAGGIPGGYCGRIPGDPGESNILGRLVFQVPSLIVSDELKDIIEIDFTPKTRALLNDGLGTEDIIITRGAKINYTNTPTGAYEEWRDLVERDNIPPEPFVVELHQKDDIYGGKYYIIFLTNDKQSGVDHYEILEIKPEEMISEEPKLKWYEKLLGTKSEAPEWTEGEMPYLLKDQSLKSIIKVKAVDKAGNERTVEYIPPREQTHQPDNFFQKNKAVLLLITGILLLIIIFYILIKRIRSRRKNEEEL